MAEFRDIRNKFITVLLSIPGVNNPTTRDQWLADIPSARLVLRDWNNAQSDFDLIINGLNGLGRLKDGRYPVIVLAEHAQKLIQKGGLEGGDLDLMLEDVTQELNIFYSQQDNNKPPIPLQELAKTPEALIFGPDTRLSHSFIEGARRTSRSIARLRVPRIFDGDREGGYIVGTGWVVAPNHIITNYHVVEARDRKAEAAAGEEDMTAQTSQMTFWFDYFREQGQPGVECTGATIVDKDEELDYAILHLNEADKIHDRPPLHIIKEQPRLTHGRRINIAQHPDGKPLKYAIRNNFFVPYGDKSYYMHYQTDTEGGSSGSPVCDDDWRVIGLHHYSVDVSPMPVSQEVISGQPSLVRVLNRAVAIRSILDDLQPEVRQLVDSGQEGLEQNR